MSHRPLSLSGKQFLPLIGRLNPNGTLSIIDRKENIFKLAQGEYVAIEKVGMVLAEADIIGQLWGYGDGYQTHLIGVVVPDFEVFHSGLYFMKYIS